MFLQSNQTLAFFIDPLIGPLVAMVSFIFADLIIISNILIYKQY